MAHKNYLKLILAFSLLILLTLSRANGLISTDFYYKNGDWYDTWGIDRNRYDGSHGYLPNLANETLGLNKELAFSIGEDLKNTYPNKIARAEAILKYVQTWTTYGYDSDNVVKDGFPQDEWAWNADEMAHKINKTTGINAVGDCEDMAFLCATIYTGADIDAAIVDAPEHVACLIWLPNYPNADTYWDIPNDNRNAGWIWVEATGESNPLGWTPPDFSDGNWDAYPVNLTLQTGTEPTPIESNPPEIQEPIPVDLIVFGAIAVIALIVISSLSSSRKKSRYLPPPPPLH